MSKQGAIKMGLVVLLVVPWFVVRRTHPGFDPVWMLDVVLVFGIVNLQLSPPGTRWVRVAAVALTSSALIWPGDILWLNVFLICLFWPPAFTVAWALARDSRTRSKAGGIEGETANWRAKMGTAAMIVAVVAAAIAYRLLVLHDLQQTAALFIGIPAILAVLVVFGVSPRSAEGVASKAVTVGLLVSLVFLGEGIVCILMSAPLFYAVAIGIAKSMKVAHGGKGASTTFSSWLIIFAVLPMSLEGVSPLTSFNRAESVVVSSIVNSPAEAVGRALAETPRFNRPLPAYLRIGFPTPIATRIERKQGIRWVIQFRGGEMRLDGVEPRTGDLVLELEEMREGRARWRAVSDGSHMTHYLSWRYAIVEWEPVDAGRTRVTWTLGYSRDLDPAWYFGPMERYAVRLAAGYLIDSVATP